MKKTLSIFLAAFCAALLAFALPGCAAPKVSSEPTPEKKAEIKAEAAYKAGDFQASADAFMEAIALSEGKNPEMEKACKLRLAQVYYDWALYVSTTSKSEKTVDDCEKAISLCKSAVEMDPRLKDKCANLTEKCRKKIAIIKYHAELTNVQIVSEDQGIEGKIGVFLKQGDAYYAAKDYAESRRCYEKVIRIDPYNANAIQGIKKVDLKVAEAGKARAENARAEMIAEVKWANVQPLPPKAAAQGEWKTIDSKQPEDTTEIEKALREISFPFLSFEKASLPDVFKKLEVDSAAAGYPLKFEFDGVDVNSPDLPLVSFKTDRISLAEALNSVCKPFELLFVPAGGNKIKVFKKPKGLQS